MVMEHTAGFDDIHFREYAKVDDPDMTLAEGLAYNPGSRVSRWRPGYVIRLDAQLKARQFAAGPTMRGAS